MDKGFKDTVENRALPCLHGVTRNYTTVPLSKVAGV